PARMAAFLYDADAAEGKVLFDYLLQQYAAPSDMPIHKDVMQLAFYLARYQPLVSWELLQIDWARAGNSAFTQAGLALAMSALDFDEALRWARQINGRTGPDESLATMRQDTQRALYEMALMEPAVRRNVCIDC